MNFGGRSSVHSSVVLPEALHISTGCTDGSLGTELGSSIWTCISHSGNPGLLAWVARWGSCCCDITSTALCKVLSSTVSNLTSQQICEVGLVVPILWMRKMRHEKLSVWPRSPWSISSEPNLCSNACRQHSGLPFRALRDFLSLPGFQLSRWM